MGWRVDRAQRAGQSGGLTSGPAAVAPSHGATNEFGSLARSRRVRPRSRHDPKIGVPNWITRTTLASPNSPRRHAALLGASYTRLDQLAEVSESDLKKLHGMGPTAITAIREALHGRGLKFRE